MVDNHQITVLVNKDPLLKFKFLGCFARDNFPLPKDNQFLIVNTDVAESRGEHWLLIASKASKILLYDSFGRDFKTFFPTIFIKLKQHVTRCEKELFQYIPNNVFQQPLESTDCGIYCIFMAHIFYSTKRSLHSSNDLIVSNFPLYATEHDVLRFLAANFC